MGVWEAARQIAGRCLADPPQAGWTVRKLVGELRLLNIVARQWAWRAQFPAALQPQGPRIRREAAPKFEREAGTLSLAPPTPAAPPPAQAATPSSALEFGRTVRQPRMSAVRCPRCGAAEIRPSNPRSDFEETLEFWHMPVLQCHNCSFRYFRFLFLKIRKAAQD